MLKKAGAILYPDRILIETWHTEPDGYAVASNIITFIAADAAADELGALLVKHLGASLNAIPSSGPGNGFKTMEQLYREATGLKTLRAQMKNARFVMADLEAFRIRLTPTRNGGPTGAEAGYNHKPEEAVTVINSADYGRIGQALRKAWANCE